MNDLPIFKISGSDRRKVKKELHIKKYSMKMFHFYNDIDTVYGGGYNMDETNKHLDKMQKEINILEESLSEKH